MSKNGSKTLSNNFIGEISQVFNGKSERDNPNAVLQDYIFNKTLFAMIDMQWLQFDAEKYTQW